MKTVDPGREEGSMYTLSINMRSLCPHTSRAQHGLATSILVSKLYFVSKLFNLFINILYSDHGNSILNEQRP